MSSGETVVAPARSTTRTERALAGFDDLLNPELVRSRLEASVGTKFFGGRRIATCVVRSVRYKTYESSPKRQKSSALAIYDLTFDSGSVGQPVSAQIYLRSFLDPHRRPPLTRASGRVTTVPGLSAIAWLVDGDPSMPDLAELLDPERVHLVVPDDAGPIAQAPTSSKVLRYKPEDRCTVEVQTAVPGQSTTRLVAKTFASSSRTQALGRTSRSISDGVDKQQARLVVPELISRSGSTLWFTHVAGTTPRRCDLDQVTLAAIGTALADFHGLKNVTDVLRSRLNQLEQTQRKAEAIQAAFPDAARPLLRVIEMLGPGAEISCDDAVTVHGAFRLRQLLIHNARIGLVDFDSVALGDRTEDLADFILDLGFGTDEDGAVGAIQTFLEAYETNSKTPVDKEQMRWQLPIQIVKRAHWLRSEARGSLDTKAKLLSRLERAADGRQLWSDLTEVMG